MPFKVPDNWIWCKLEDITSFGGGKTPLMDNNEYWDNGKHLWITSKDMKCSHITNSLMKITDKALEVMTIYEKGTLLVVTRSGILRHTLPLSILEKPATVNQDLKAILPHIQELSEYLYIVIKANEYFILKEYHKDGTTVDSIDFDKFRCLPIPLAPFAEQRRIIIETKRWFALIDQIERGKLDLQKVVKEIKSKILDLAIHGKLVPQDPDDEPASELLKRINPKAEITCDNGHYPLGWCKTQLKYIADYVNGRAFKPEEWETNGLPIVRIQNLNDETAPYNKSSKSYEEKYLIHKGDLLFAWAASLGTYVWEKGDAWLNQHIFKVIPFVFMDKLYLYYSLESLIKDFYKESHGSGMVHITKKKFEDIECFVPPLAEQQRIVAKIEELFSILDSIQKSLEA